jgi:hypothetical protein
MRKGWNVLTLGMTKRVKKTLCSLHSLSGLEGPEERAETKIEITLFVLTKAKNKTRSIALCT